MECIRKNISFLQTLYKKALGEKTGAKSITTLAESCHAGKKKICKIIGDRKMCANMASMGLYPGEEIFLLCGDSSARCVLRLAGGTLCLDEAASQSILVESM